MEVVGLEVGAVVLEAEVVGAADVLDDDGRVVAVAVVTGAVVTGPRSWAWSSPEASWRGCSSAEAGGTVGPAPAELGDDEPENPEPVVEVGLVPATVGVTDAGLASLGRVVAEVEGVEVGEKLLVPLPPDKPDDREELLPPRLAPEEPEAPDVPEAPDDGLEVGEKLLVPPPPDKPDDPPKSYCPRRPRRSPTYPRPQTTGWK